jgi:hypothetical protein
MQADTNTPNALGRPLPRLAFIGGGNMAHAIVSGATDAGTLDPARVVVADPSAQRRALYTHAVSTAADAIAWLGEHESEPGRGQVVLAVKPQVFPRVVEEIGGARRDGARACGGLDHGGHARAPRSATAFGGRCPRRAHDAEHAVRRSVAGCDGDRAGRRCAERATRQPFESLLQRGGA